MPFDEDDKAFFKTAPGKGEGNRGIFIGPVTVLKVAQEREVSVVSKFIE